MAGDGSKKPDAADVLAGRRAAPEKPAEMTRQTVHFTPLGTETRMSFTPEASAYLAELARQDAERARREAARGQAPGVPRKALSQERNIRKEEIDRESRPVAQSKKDKDKDNDRDL